MSYQIEYTMNKIRWHRWNIKSEIFTGIVFVALLVAGTVSLYFCSHIIQGFCLKHADHVQIAAEQLVDDLISGVEVKDAVQTFCAEFSE